ncbi:FAD-dependent monooxygenase [Tomitella gaofuii]|uniref:FAD-dependent monooxygenase n=1 Tax=Tomitella gaofuii TaxID=2760083 RepID=UPI0015FCB1D9|nr:FAD-dependent monooxygenase [Tomitella gaofuii]
MHPVAVVGAGPVGMTLALDLALRGTRVLLLDTSATTTTNPRCNTTNARSMEYFRRLGLAGRIRRAGLPGDHATDVVYCTSMTGHELTRFEFSSSDEVLDGSAAEFDDWPTPEPQHRISQIYLEPVLDSACRDSGRIDVRRGHSVESVRDDGDAAVLSVRTGSGEQYEVAARYVVGCDGGASTVRRMIGAVLEGDGEVSERRHSVQFRSPSLAGMLGDRPGWMYWWYGRQFRGSLIRLDGGSLFLCHARVPEGVDPDSVDTDVMLDDAIGRRLDDIDTVGVVRWTARRLVADRFRDGRILLAGDAAHLWLPLGGFGMNTGIGDAMALSWRLHAVLSGWAGERVFDDYEGERRSVGEATSRAALKIDSDMQEIARDPALHEPGPLGASLRRQAGARIEQIDRKQWYSQGVQFGAKYSGTPGIDGEQDGDAAIASIGDYVPSVVAGARLPHHWRPGGDSLFDQVGDQFTLLRIGAGAPAAGPFAAAAAAAGIPLAVLDIDEPVDPAIYGDATMVLVRPDQVVAWSGPTAPADPGAVFSRLLGLATAMPVRHSA